MKYLYRATFQDGTEFRQPKHDLSLLCKGKSSKYDFLEHSKGRKLLVIGLAGGDHEVIARSDGWFIVDGKLTAPGGKLPEGCEWVEGDPTQGAYFRRVTKTYNSGLEEIETTTQFCVGIGARPGVRNFVGVV